MALIQATVREILSPWSAILFLFWVFLSGHLSFGPLPGAESLGSLAAFLSLIPIVLLFQACRMVEHRGREAWRFEEELRDPRGFRMPFAEWATTAFLVALLFLLAMLLHNKEAEKRRGTGKPVSYPLFVSHQDDTWELQHLGAAIPNTATVSALLTWETAPKTDAEGFAKTWERAITSEEALTGIIREKLPQGAVVHPEFARLLISPQSGPSLARLLFGQFFFFLPLLSLAFLLVRRGVRAELAAIGSLSLGGLAAWQSTVVLSREQLSGFEAALVQTLQWANGLLPDVGPLFAVGRHYLLSTTQLQIQSMIAWIFLGLLACVLSSHRFRKR